MCFAKYFSHGREGKVRANVRNAGPVMTERDDNDRVCCIVLCCWQVATSKSRVNVRHGPRRDNGPPETSGRRSDLRSRLGRVQYVTTRGEREISEMVCERQPAPGRRAFYFVFSFPFQRSLICGLLFVAWLFGGSSSAAHPPSPCPDVFAYEGSEPEYNRWYGEISLITDESLVGIRLDVELDRPADLMVVSFAFTLASLFFFFKRVRICFSGKQTTTIVLHGRSRLLHDNIKHHVRAYHVFVLFSATRVRRFSI